MANSAIIKFRHPISPFYYSKICHVLYIAELKILFDKFQKYRKFYDELKF